MRDRGIMALLFEEGRKMVGKCTASYLKSNFWFSLLSYDGLISGWHVSASTMRSNEFETTYLYEAYSGLEKNRK